MTDLDELRQVLREREALAPDPEAVASAALARGVRIRRVRRAGTLAGAVAAAVTVIAVAAAVLARPHAIRQLPGHDVVTGGWPVVPSYTGPAVPGHPTVPGPTSGPTEPASGRSIDPVVPYTVTLPAGWRESDWWYEEGSFRGSYIQGGLGSAHICAINVLDPATQPASLLVPAGNPATGAPDSNGTLAWRADNRHFVRVQLQGDPEPELFRSIVRTIDFDHQRAMISPFSLGYLPASLHMSGASIRFSYTERFANGSNYTAWSVGLWFDAGTGATPREGHDLTIFAGPPAGAAPTPPIEHPITVGGYPASSHVSPDGATELAVYGVHGQNIGLYISRSARDRITLVEAGRIVQGIGFVDRPDDTATWLPLHLP